MKATLIIWVLTTAGVHFESARIPVDTLENCRHLARQYEFTWRPAVPSHIAAAFVCEEGARDER